MATGAANTQTVTILGNQYTLRGHADPERMIELARYVDDKLRSARHGAEKPQDLTKVAILTSLNIAYELFDARNRVEEDLHEARRRTGDLIDRLDRCLVDVDGAVSNGRSQ